MQMSRHVHVHMGVGIGDRMSTAMAHILLSDRQLQVHGALLVISLLLLLSKLPLLLLLRLHEGLLLNKQHKQLSLPVPSLLLMLSLLLLPFSFHSPTKPATPLELS